MTAIFTGLGAGFARGSGAIIGNAGVLGNGTQGRSGEQVSVNAATGNVLITQQDEILTGRGLDIGISRTYNSLFDAADGDNGDQWQQSTHRRVFGLSGTLNTAGSTIKRQYGDGSVITYTWNAVRSAYLTREGDGAHDTLTFAGNQWTWTDGSSQVQEIYEQAFGSTTEYRLAQQRDSNANTVIFSYQANSNRLDRITTANGEYVQYGWSGNNVTQVTTVAGGTLTRTRYSYDGSNRLSQVIVDLSPGDNSIADGKTYVTTYTYDGTSKRVASITQSDGSSLTITYDGSGRVLTLTQLVASGDTRVTTLSYGANFTNVTAPNGQITRLDYDAAKQLTKITAPPASAGATAQVVQFAYDAGGNLSSVTDALGRVTAYAYIEASYDPAVTNPANQSGTNDANGNLTRITAANGDIITRTYTARNQLLMETTTGSAATGSAVAAYKRFAYDANNNLRYVVSAEGYVTEYRYTGNGLLDAVIEYPEATYTVGNAIISEALLNSWRDALADKQSTKFTQNVYDTRGNLSQTINYGYANAAGAPLVTEGYRHSYFSYDQSGRMLGKIIAREDNSWSNYVYDGLGRMIASTDNYGATSTIVFNDAATTTTVTTAGGMTSVSTYNKAGDLVSVTTSGSYDNIATTSYQYDKLGRVRVETSAIGQQSYYIYDNAGRMTASINPHGWMVEYQYDANNRVIGEARYTHNVTSANLTALANPNNTLTAAAVRPSSYPYDIWTWTVYDNVGRVAGKVDGAGRVTAFAYDQSNNLIKTTSYFNTLTQTQVDAYKSTPPATLTLPPVSAAKDSIARTFYDRDGRLIGALNAEGYLSEIVYDKAGQKVQEVAYAQKTTSATFATDSFNTLRTTVASTSAANRRTRYVYDGQGLLRYTIDSLNQVTAYIYHEGINYDATGLVRGTVQFATPLAAGTADYTYDNIKALLAPQVGSANNRQTWNVYDGSRLAFSIDALGGVTGFAYDNMGRVTRTTQYGALRATTSLPSLVDMQNWASANASDVRISRNYYTAAGDLRYTVDAEGYVMRYDYNAKGEKVREVSWANKIVVGDGTTIGGVDSATGGAGTWIDRNYGYYSNGRLYSSYDGNGVATIYSYFANGTLADVYTAHGTLDQSVSLIRYDGAGQVRYEYSGYNEPDSTESVYVSHTYDGLGNRLSTTDARGFTTYYEYDELGQMTKMTDALGNITTYEYNAFGEVVKVTDPRGNASYNYYDSLGRVTTSRDAENYLTQTGYTVFGDIASVTRRYNRTTSAVSLTTVPTATAHTLDATTSFEYDKRGMVTRTTDAAGYFETYTYNGFGQRLTSVAKSASNAIAAGGTTTYAYDRRGLLVSETMPVISYNAGGGIQSSSVTNSYEYDARGNRTKMVEAAGLPEARTTQYEYDKNNRLIKTVGQTFLGQTPISHIKYDARGNVTETIDPVGARTVYFYDDLNRKVVEINAVGTYTAYSYDANSNIARIRVYGSPVGLPPEGGSQEEAPAVPVGAWRETIFTYDAINRMLTSVVTGVDSNIFDGANYVLQATNLTVAYQYDANGNVVKLTDANGNATHSYYDAAGRKIAQVDAGGYRTDWTYDSEGNVLSETRYANQAAAAAVGAIPAVTADSANDRVTNFTYDKVGNRLSETRLNVLINNSGSPGNYTTANATISYLYNGLGQVVRKTESTGDQINYTYDAGGRLTREARNAFTAHDGASVTPTVDYFYNGLGNLSRTVAGGGGDAAARVTTYYYDGDKLRWMTDSSGFSRLYWYDVGGRLTYDYYTRIKSDGTAAAEYDGMLKSYDALGRVTQQWQARHVANVGWVTDGPITSTTYNAYGEVATVAVGNTIQQRNQYDSGGRLKATNSGDGVWKYFAYDANGNQTIAITSAGEDFSGGAGNLGIGYGAALSKVGQTNVNATYTRYDNRNLATIVTEEGRQLSAAGGLVTLNTSRSYNAFGEVIAETNANGATINYSYNTMGRLIKSESPWVSITGENGVASTVRPTEQYYYDISGRLVATRDANNNLSRMTLLAGTGYDGTQALVLSETHADGGVKAYGYDIHGDLRRITDELGRVTTRAYDAMGRVTQITSPNGFINYYAYDGLGQQIKHWNNQLQTPIYGEPVLVGWDYYGEPIYDTPVIGYAPDVETTDYDTQGRVIATRSFGGDVTTNSYTWSDSISTLPGIATGGWTEVTTYANGRTMTEVTDLFGRAKSKTDLGGHLTTYGYDFAARMTSASTDGNATNYTYLNTGLVGRVSQINVTVTNIEEWVDEGYDYGYGYGYNITVGTSTTTTDHGVDYSYDAVGNRIAEYGTDNMSVFEDYYYYGYTNSYSYSSVWKNQTATYDALGRLQTWSEAGTTGLPAASIDYDYDANGNVRRTYATYRTLDANGTASSAATVKDYWFRYDAMNRLVTDKGILSGGTIVRGFGSYGTAGGQDILYNLAGERIAVLSTQYAPGSYYYYYTPGSYTEQRESYTYDAVGRLTQIRVSQGTPVFETSPGSGIPNGTLPAAPVSGTLRSFFSYDLMGRQTGQTDYEANGTTVAYSRTASFNDKSQLTYDSTVSKKGSDTYRSDNYYDYGYGANYALGQVLVVTSTNYKNNNNGNAPDTRTTNTYVWWDGAVQSSISHDGDTGSNSNPVYWTYFSYDGQGRLISASIGDYLSRTVSFTNDENGQIIRRDEGRPYYAPAAQQGSPHEVWYRYGGRQLGYVGNNGTSDVNTATSIAERQIVSPTPGNIGTFRNDATYGQSYVDFAQSYDPLSSYNQGSGAGTYTVRSGDTLQSIAYNIYGDANLWYKLAEANGISGGGSLTEGTSLLLPAGVMKTGHSASTQRAYDPQDAIGDLSPTNAKPPKKNKCGVFGQILLAVIAIAVTAITYGALGGAALTGWSAVGAGALAGAAGSVASQAVGVATGIQDKFSFKAVALAALGGAISGGLGPKGLVGTGGAFSKIGSEFVAQGLRGALSSALTQGIGVATGLQEKFSWAGVAAAGVGAAVGGAIGRSIEGKSFLGQTINKGDFGYTFAVAAAGGIANAATRSAINGESFGKNLIAALPDIIGQALGGAIGDRVLNELSGGPENLIPDAFWENVVSQPAEQVAANPSHEESHNLASFDTLTERIAGDIAGSASNNLTNAASGAQPASAAGRPDTGASGGRPNGSSSAGGGDGARPSGSSGDDLDPIGDGVGLPDISILVDGAAAAAALTAAVVANAIIAPSIDTSDLVHTGSPVDVLSSDHAAELLAGWRAEFRQTGMGQNGFDILVQLEAERFRWLVKEGARTVDEIVPAQIITFEQNIDLGEELPLIDDIYDRAAYISILATDGPGPRPESGWRDWLFSPLDTLGKRSVYEAELQFHLRYQSYVGQQLPNTDAIRAMPGTAYSSLAGLDDISGRWLTSSPANLPGQVARRLEGRQFNSFGEFRSAVWATVADIPELAVQFSSQNLQLMRAGNAPFAPSGGQVGGRQVFELHHDTPLSSGGFLYDMRNIRVVTPKAHIDIHRGP